MVEVEVLSISDEEIFQKLEELKHLHQENSDLKRLLKSAVEEIHNLKYKQRFVLGYDANFDWEYEDEAKGLINNGK
ncbi:MAG: hypothetical protein K2H01_03215 [Ruminococcus sp.]|nr:hypothetical protein [Ruminococcus sp.]